MIDPRTQYILHQERQNELMTQIERKLAAQGKDFVGQTDGAAADPLPWYSIAQRWLREKRIRHGFAAGQPIPAGKSH